MLLIVRYIGTNRNYFKFTPQRFKQDTDNTHIVLILHSSILLKAKCLEDGCRGKKELCFIPESLQGVM
jgi:hypothetical protein